MSIRPGKRGAKRLTQLKSTLIRQAGVCIPHIADNEYDIHSEVLYSFLLTMKRIELENDDQRVSLLSLTEKSTEKDLTRCEMNNRFEIRRSWNDDKCPPGKQFCLVVQPLGRMQKNCYR